MHGMGTFYPFKQKSLKVAEIAFYCTEHETDYFNSLQQYWQVSNQARFNEHPFYLFLKASEQKPILNYLNWRSGILPRKLANATQYICLFLFVLEYGNTYIQMPIGKSYLCANINIEYFDTMKSLIHEISPLSTVHLLRLIT